MEPGLALCAAHYDVPRAVEGKGAARVLVTVVVVAERGLLTNRHVPGEVVFVVFLVGLCAEVLFAVCTVHPVTFFWIHSVFGMCVGEM